MLSAACANVRKLIASYVCHAAAGALMINY